MDVPIYLFTLSRIYVFFPTNISYPVFFSTKTYGLGINEDWEMKLLKRLHGPCFAKKLDSGFFFRGTQLFDRIETLRFSDFSLSVNKMASAFCALRSYSH